MKEKASIKVVGIEEFRSISHAIDYMDEDFIIIHSLNELPYCDETIRLSCFVSLVCLEGRIQLYINNNKYVLEKDDTIVCMPHSTLSNVMLSPHCQIRLAGVSSQFLGRVVKMEKETWNNLIYVYKNPIKHISKNQGRDSKLYFDLLAYKMKEKPHRYHKEIMQHLFAALLCEWMAETQRRMEQTDPADLPFPRGGELRQSDHIFKDFIEKVATDNGMHRSVSYFADQLCYTPKHLSKVVKDTCNKTPLEIINAAAIEHIKYRLKHSDKSIKEVAEEFRFSNQSFFGKYVKKLTGYSPQAYRNLPEE